MVFVFPFIGIAQTTKLDSIKNEISLTNKNTKISDKFMLYSELTDEYKVLNDTLNYVKTAITLSDLSRAAGSQQIALILIEDLMKSGLIFQPIDKVHACLVRGATLYEVSRFDEAINWAYQGLDYGKEYGINQYDALLNNVLGAGYVYTNADSAIKYFEISAQLFLQKNDTLGAILPYINTARAYTEVGEYKKAIALVNKANQFLDEKEEPVYREMAYANFVRIYKRTKEYEKSNYYIGLRDSVSAVINNRQSKFEVSQFNKRLEAGENARERMELESKIEMAQMQNQKNQIIIVLAIILIVVLGFVLFVVIKVSRNRKKMTRMMAKKASELETVNKFKNRILSVISHDMRSPLAQMITFQHAKNSGINFSPDEVREMDKTIMASAKNGLLILDNLLKWANNQFDGKKITKETIDSRFVVLQIINQLSEISKEKDIVIHADICDKEIITNESLFQIIIRNLLSNAIKFSPLHSELRISSKVVGNNLEVKITDQGPGIPDEILESLRKGKTIKPKLGSFGEKGAGIGLSFSKEFAERIKGSFHFTPELLVGTEVVFSLPIE